MKSVIKSGDNVVILSRGNSSYAGRFVGECGVVQRVSSCSYGILLDNYTNPSSGYGVYWFKSNEIKLVNGEEDISMNEAKCVKISFMNEVRNKCTHNFAVYEEEIARGDYVVVKTRHHGLSVGVVDEVIESGVVENGREVVCKFDISAYSQRKEKRERIAELEKRMSRRFDELQKIAVYEMMAQTDEQMKTMLDELKSLQ